MEYQTTIGFPTKNDHFGVFWGYHHLRKEPYMRTLLLKQCKYVMNITLQWLMKGRHDQNDQKKKNISKRKYM